MKLALLFAALGVAQLSAQAPSLTPAQVARIDSVFAPFDKTNRPGCALGISQGGTLIYQKGYGMSNLEYGIAISPASIFHVASISKQFTAFSVGLLADDGKLSLDDDVRKFIPELPSYGKPITLRHLIYHTSGVRDQWELLGMAGWRGDTDVITEQDILDIVIRQRALNFVTGDEYLYSNAGYTLLAIVVKRVSGQRLRQFAEARIFQPLGMNDTHFHNDHSMVVPNRTSAYVPRPEGGWAISIPVFDNDGATSLFTTPADLLKWEQNFVDGKVGSRRLLDDAMTSGKLNSGKSIDYGFGLSIGDFRGQKVIGHGGADAGYRADVARFPESGYATAVLCNFGPATPGTYARQVAAVLLGDKLAPAAGNDLSNAKPVHLSPAELKAVAGSYKNVLSDEAARVVVRDTQVVFENFGVSLTPLGPRRFTAFGALIEFTGGTTEPTDLVVSFGDEVLGRYRRVASVTLAPKDLAQFAGEFWSKDLGVTYRVVLQDTALVIKRPRLEDGPLVPAYADTFGGPDGSTFRFLRGTAGTTKGPITGLSITGGRVRAVEFARVNTGRW